MNPAWDDGQPIYQQLRDRIAVMLLDGTLNEGDALPSVRNIAADYRVNPLTVSRGYQDLVDQGLVESRRGLGMYVRSGARSRLLSAERRRFLKEQWPKVAATIVRLGLRPEELLHELKEGQ